MVGARRATRVRFEFVFDVVHMFYMKTCSFRFARPRSLNEGLFCAREPEARYELSACGNCALCHPRYDRGYRTKHTVVDFSRAHHHKFVSGYEVVLNCSAVRSRVTEDQRLRCALVHVSLVLRIAQYYLCIDVPLWKGGLYRCNSQWSE